MKIAIFFAILGASCALQFPLEYVYNYEGRVATGIPGIKPQVAGTGFRAKLTLQMRSKTQAVAKLNDINVGEYHGDEGCEHLRKPMPIQYSPLSGSAQKLEQPFSVNFVEDQGQVLQVPEGEEEWITNIRKSIVQVLRLEPVLGNLGGSKNDPMGKKFTTENIPESFSLEEETIMGRCRSEYTLQMLPDYVSAVEEMRLKKHIKEDVQVKGGSTPSASSVPALKKDLWRLVRAIDFDNCHERVVLQKATVSNMTKSCHAQFKAFMSRSSVGEYILRGEGGSFRVESAVIEGTILAHPFGHKMEKLQTIINQTIVLEEVRSIKTPLQVPSGLRPVKTWNYEVASPFSAPSGYSPLWVNYKGMSDKFAPFLFESVLTGIKMTPKLIDDMKRGVLDLLNKATEELTSSPKVPSETPGPWNNKVAVAATHLMSAIHAVRALPVPKIEEIFTQVFQKHDKKGQLEQMLLIDIMAAAGTASPIKVLLEKMKSGQITSTRAATIFMTLTNHLSSPAVINELLEFVKTLNIEEKPYLTSAALINFAKVSHRMCLDHRTFNYSAPNRAYGKEICQPSEIISNFLPYLKQKLDSSTKTWERAIYIQALANLEVPQILPILEPYIYGKKDNSPRLRTTAIYALSRLPRKEKEQVFEILMKLVDSLGEDLEVRQAAFATLLSWHPSASWWQRVARLTWREPSREMAAFITFTIEGVAMSTDPHLSHQAKIAMFVLPLCKPFSPNLRTSFNGIWSRYMPHKKIAADFNLAWLSSLESVFPREIYTFLNTRAGGFNYEVFEVALGAEGLHKPFFHLLDELQLFSQKRNSETHSFSPKSPRHRRSAEEADTIWQAKEKQLNPSKFIPQKPELSVLLRLFDKMEHYFHINSEVIEKIIGNGGSKLIEELIRGKSINMTKLVNAVPIQFFLPTEVGLPMIGSVAAPILNVGNVHLQLRVPGKSQIKIHELLKEEKIELTFRTEYKAISKVTTMMKTLIPWKDLQIASVVDSVKVIDLPVQGRVIVHNEAKVKNITVEITPTVREKIPVLYAHNMPLTIIKPLMPGTDLTKLEKMRLITAYRPNEPLIKRRVQTDPRKTGIEGYVQFDADVPFPYNAASIFEYLRKPLRLVTLLTSPTSRMWQTAVVYDPSSSPAKDFSLAFTWFKISRGGSSEQLYKDADYDYDQSKRPSPRNEESRAHSEESSRSSGPGISVMDSPQERIEKLKQLLSGERVYAMSLALMTKGREYRKFETVAALSLKGDEGEEKKYKSLLALLASPLSRYHEEPSALCFEVTSTTPNIRDIESLKQRISSELKMQLQAKIMVGRTCESKSIAHIEASSKLSQERKERLAKEVHEICNFDNYNPLVEFSTAAVYDEARMEVKYERSSIPRPLLNATYIIGNIFQGVAFPNIYINEMEVHNPEGRISLQAKRPMTTDRWTIWAQLPKKNVIVDHVYVPYVCDRLVPMSGLNFHWSRLSPSNAVLAAFGNPKCTIRSEQITTFDGVSYSFPLTKCYTTAVWDRRNAEEWYLDVHRSQSGEKPVAHIFFKEGTAIEITNNWVKVNGDEVEITQSRQPIKDNNNRVLVMVTKSNQDMKVEMPKMWNMIVKSDVMEVYPTLRTKGQLRGLCGDNDGQTKFDKTGPKECVYHDDNLFGWSWTVSHGEGCNKQEVEEHRKEIENYQQSCPKRPSRQQTSSLYKETQTCFQYVYPVLEREGSLCITKEPIRRCDMRCSMESKTEANTLCKCWPKREAPEELKNSIERGYSFHPVNSRPMFSKSFDVRTDTVCKPNKSRS